MLVEMKYKALNILKYSWPMLIMAVLIVSTLRIAYLVNNKLKCGGVDENKNMCYYVCVCRK